MKIFIDPGHGGKDPGAVGNGLQEKNITLAIALQVGKILKENGVVVVYSRTTDTHLTLSERAQAANNVKADIFVSIHTNAAENISARGLETYGYPGSNDGTKLANSIQNHLMQSKVFTADRGIKAADFAVLRETRMTAALVELGFISNAQDAAILKNKQAEIAVALARGILGYFGVSYALIEPVRPEPAKPEPATMEPVRPAIDTPSVWAAEAWTWAFSGGLLDGTRPRDALTREEFAVVLRKLKL